MLVMRWNEMNWKNSHESLCDFSMNDRKRLMQPFSERSNIKENSEDEVYFYLS